MESIDLELGELFDRDAVDDGDEGEDVGAHAVGHGDDEAATDGAEGNIGHGTTNYHIGLKRTCRPCRLTFTIRPHLETSIFASYYREQTMLLICI